MSYCISSGYRLVVPYLHASKAIVPENGMDVMMIAKKRWPFLKYSDVESAVIGGRVLCNERSISSPCEVLKKSDIINFTYHLHEPEVLAEAIDIIHLSEDTLVVNKPPSVPAHPVRRFRMNTVPYILVSQHPHLLYDKKELYPVHRIDRLASGLLIFARTQEASVQFSSQFASRSIQKEYLARVKGNFPDGIIKVDKPIVAINKYPVVYGTSSEGKSSLTIFEKESVSPDGSESIIRCWPLTGRSHQIRVHLKWLGHPISNDFKYGGNLNLSQFHNPVPKIDNYEKMSWCPECICGGRNTHHVAYGDLTSTSIWLHSLCYTSTHPKHRWAFEAPRPAWSYL